MRKVKCQDCGREFPMSETFEVDQRILCGQCTENFVSNHRDFPAKAIKQQIDPTICFRCGKDYDTEVKALAGLPTCSDCEAFFRNRPFPNWLKVCFVALLILVVFSLFYNGRFIRAYIDMRRSVAASIKADLGKAATLMDSASNYVPENESLGVYAHFYNGLFLLQQEQCQEAIKSLSFCLGKLPPEVKLEQLIMHAKTGLAYDNKDYDGFLQLSLQMSKESPNDPICIAQVASAYACKYAITGDEHFKQESLKILGQARAVSKKDDKYFKEYEQRILYRLYTKEIISRKEFIEKYPNGWKEPERE